MMKITLTVSKPRNPLIAPARFRQAGAHRRSTAALRHKAERDLQRELDRLKPPHR